MVLPTFPRSVSPAGRLVWLLAAAALVAGTAATAPAAHAAPVTTPSPSGHAPRGHANRFAVRGGVAHVSGWALDPDTTGTIKVRVFLDRRIAARVRADRWSRKLARHRHGAAARHGFSVAVTIPQGRHRLCASAVNSGRGHNERLRCGTVRADYRKPAPPTRLRAAQTDTSITVRWHKPHRRGGGVLHAFRIKAVDGAGRITFAHAPPSEHTATVSGLRPSHTYTVSVRATNAAYRSDPASVQVTTDYPPIPAQRSPAPVAHSHYLRRLNGDTAHDERLMYRMGAADGALNPRGHRYLVLQDIGAQTHGGVLLSATVTYIAYPELVDALESYIAGYASAQQYNAPALIAVGTNNDGWVSRRQGMIWAQQVVTPLARWARHHTTRISVAGADDMEPGFSGGRYATRAWLGGFLSGGNARFVFNGSADGCPAAGGTTACNNGWTVGTLHWLAGAADPSRVTALPQIYNTVMPWQWQVISSFHGERLRFGGPLTEHRACVQQPSCVSVRSPRAWHLLYGALASSPGTAVHALPYGPDLRIS